MTAALDISGMRFGRLVAVSRGDNDRFGKARWICVCDCGQTTFAHATLLRRGTTSSCGCLHKERSSETAKTSSRKHGYYGTPTYRTWQSMIARCTNPNATGYHNYGGRGIEICDAWRRFEGFLADMGDRPQGMTLDRIDVNGHYEPTNCRWADDETQRANTRANQRRRDVA